MNTDNILQDLRTLNNPEAFTSFMRWLGTRTKQELLIICGTKRKAYGYLIEKAGRQKSATTELEAFVAAGAALRRHRPHNARTLALIAAEREARKKQTTGKGLRGRLEQDFEDVEAYLANGYTWPEISKALRTRDNKYRGISLKPNSLRKTFERIKTARAAAEQPAPEPEPIPKLLPAPEPEQPEQPERMNDQPEPIPEPAPEPPRSVGERLQGLAAIPRDEMDFL